MYESDEVKKASQLFKIEAYGVIGDVASQKEEAFNIGVAPQTINNWLVNYTTDMPAFALARMQCGNILLAYLQNEWGKRFGDRDVLQTEKLSEIEMAITEHLGIINGIVRHKFDQSQKHEAIDRMQKLKDAIMKMEVELHRILESGGM